MADHDDETRQDETIPESEPEALADADDESDSDGDGDGGEAGDGDGDVEVPAGAGKDEPDKKNKLIDHSVDTTQVLLQSMHDISARVRPSILDDLGLKDAIQSFVADYERRTGILPDLDLRFDTTKLPAVVADNVFRLVQEALNTVARHAGTDQVRLQVISAPDALRVHIRDEGQGFDPATAGRGRLGLLGMRERVELLEGRFDLSSAPGRGTDIDVHIPLGAQTAQWVTGYDDEQ